METNGRDTGPVEGGRRFCGTTFSLEKGHLAGPMGVGVESIGGESGRSLAGQMAGPLTGPLKVTEKATCGLYFYRQSFKQGRKEKGGRGCGGLSEK